GLRFRPEGLTRRMHRPEKLISVTEICAYTIYNRRAFEFRKSRSGLGTHCKAILLRLNSRLQSLIGFSSFLDRKSKVPHGISYFPRRKSQVSVSISHFPRKIPKFCTAFALSTRKIPKPHCISHLPRRKSQNSLSIRTFPS